MIENILRAQTTSHHRFGNQLEKMSTLVEEREMKDNNKPNIPSTPPLRNVNEDFTKDEEFDTLEVLEFKQKIEALSKSNSILQNGNKETLLNYLKEGIGEDISDACDKYINEAVTKGTFESQFGQDFFLFVNFFMNKKDGFYVDVGASRPKWLSNSYFYDKCLGWKGICIEANADFAEKLRQKRSCKVINKCVTDKKGTRNFKHDGFSGRLRDEDDNQQHLSHEIECDTLNNILDENNVKKIDFVSVDVEGQEPKVFEKFDLQKYKVDFVMIESSDIVNDKRWKDRKVEWKIENQNYWKIATLEIDYVYMRGISLNKLFKKPNKKKY